ncbi:transglutaminaseTgpA domain-containing protein [Halorubrum lipolyticum]|uniref:Transglutaminase-like domain-containing protein n=1 Tax=Halorubrum lipolyticum DSM 21995 TaxID=1227482 RepID=M0NVD7_9EURY|nr:transglutaminaseTgpA domain-containing protein [Halorubrum lipolyticum]EMA61927.1 hypothetical protein C469_05722 [Halorubrum lipolyticum DSM 21995]
MSSRVAAVMIAALCLTSVALAAPLIQPDLGSPTESATGGGSGVAESIESTLDEAEGDEPPGDRPDGGEGGEDGGPFDGERFDADDAERLGSDADPYTPGGAEGATESGGADGANAPGDDTGMLRYGALKTPYWRAATYDTYTGTGWERSTSASAYDPPYEHDGAADRRRYRVTAETPMSIVPAPYQPVAVGGLDDVVVYGDSSFDRTARMDAGTEFTVTSDVPEWSYEELERAGDDYDPDVVERYGTPREETPDRVHELTDEIVAGQSTPYGKAVAIDHWLKNERGYSLDTPEPGDDVVDEFLFEMESGYCVYFAASMTEMLRTQGIPARYATGYARASIEDGVEEVTADRAHAWVEVYIDGVGWVTLDPTPPEREDVRANDGDATATDDAVEANARYAVGTNLLSTEDGDDDWETVDADVELLSDPTPGTEGTVRVTRGGSPLVDHRVSYNGDVVGRTDADGNATGTLPYAENLEVTVEEYTAPGDPSEDETEDSADDDGEDTEDADGEESDGEEADGEEGEGMEGDGEESDGEEGEETEGDGVFDDSGNTIGSTNSPDQVEIGGPISELPTGTVFTVRHGEGGDDASSVETTERVFASGASAGLVRLEQSDPDAGISLNTAIDVTFAETPLHPGDEVDVTATIDGSPVPNATVTAGETETTTDGNGVATVPVPYAEEVRIEVERGDASGEATAPVATDAAITALNEPAVGGDLAVEVLVDDRPVEGLDVLVDEAAVAETDGNGTATVPVGYEETVDVAATRGAVRGADTFDVNTDLDVATGGLPLPGRSVTLTATAGGEPVEDATVTTGAGETTTDANGTAAVAVPVVPQSELGYVVERGDAAADGAIGLVRVWAAIAGLALGTAGAAARWTDPRSAGRQATGILRVAVERLSRVPRRTVSAVIRAAVWIGALLARGGRGTASTVRSMLAALASAAHRAAVDLPRFLAATAAGLATRARGVARRVAAFARWLAVGPRTWWRRLRRVGGSEPDEAGSARSAAGTPAVDGAEGEEPRIDPRVVVTRAWNWLVGVVRPGGSMTPREIADRATALGLPQGHVDRVLEAFRSLRYAHREPSQDDAETVADAEHSLRSARGGDE